MRINKQNILYKFITKQKRTKGLKRIKKGNTEKKSLKKSN